MTRSLIRIAVAAAVTLAAGTALAQKTSASSEIRTFEILAVDGNTLVVALPEGTRAMTVANDFRFTVNGRELSLLELKAGMKGSATISTRATVTPVTVTKVKNGTVVQSGGASIIVRTSEGLKSFSQDDVDQRSVKIMRGGTAATIADFRTGDRLTATIITAKPPEVMTEQEAQATLTATKAAGIRKLPKTASLQPSLLLAAAFLLAIGFALTLARRLTPIADR